MKIGLAAAAIAAVLVIIGIIRGNVLLNQFTADACQRAVVSGPAEAATLGVLMMQAVATGHLGSVAEGRAAIAASVPQEHFAPCAAAGSSWGTSPCPSRAPACGQGAWGSGAVRPMGERA